MILRVEHDGSFYEIHVKVFNTGRMAIPGIVNEDVLESTKTLLLKILQPNFEEELKLISEEESPDVVRLVKGKMNKETNKKEKSHFEKVKPRSNVLINSNFNCGYYIQQEKLRALLRDKYNLHPTYDPSMYPGVKCKFYYNNDLPEDNKIQQGHLEKIDVDCTMTELDELVLEKYTKVSFMIFRTGNCLIVGNCTKQILTYVYQFVKKILMDEYDNIKANQDVPVTKVKKNKPRKKNVQFTTEYYNNLLNTEKRI
jgi:TATA-box binding protein (TBP) (component of TFIID and TFIIIB)